MDINQQCVMLLRKSIIVKNSGMKLIQMIPQMKQDKYNAMLKRLDEMYSREEEIIKQSTLLKAEYDQIQEDKELLQNMIMHQANKDERKKKLYGD